MILTLYLFLLGIAVLCLGVGYFFAEGPFTLVGFFFLFLLGSILLTGDVEYKQGYNETEVYHYNNTVSPSADDPLLNTTTTRTYTYSNFSDDTSHWFGLLLAFLGGFGLAITLWNAHKDYQLRREERL